ncbi:hypothetical protein [Litoreibacter ponti]|uniref:hypothetical protein n=1 Tax=Litoreibacter ponti TaxID=1510457 RepID=UPI0011B27D37|nr:hypothetical protein [Litoreibacter ponti]
MVDAYVARIFALLGEKLGVRGRTLERRVSRAGRMLPRQIRRAAAELVQADEMAQDPRMCLRLDPEVVHAAYSTCCDYLEAIDVGARKSKARFDFAAGLIVRVGVVCAATLGILTWRGFL